MKLRSLLRNEMLQLKLEKKGAVVSPFLIPENIKWLLSVLQENPTNIKDALSLVRLHEKFNEKLQSKVEYRCINCSPFQIYFSELSDYSRQPFRLQPSITDESKFSSLHLIAPLLDETNAAMEFHYLASAHLLPAIPRGRNIPKYYENNEDYIVQIFSTLKVKSGEAVLFFGNIPYSFVPVQQNAGLTLLEISILPYEARQIIYEGVVLDNERFLQPYETELIPFIEYHVGNESALNKMKALRKIPFEPSFLSDKEKKELVVKISLQKLFLRTTGLSKFFSE